MRRREFLLKGSRAVASLSVASLAACAHKNRVSAKANDGLLWRTLITDLEMEIPKWMEDTKVPGLSIDVIKGGKLAWHRGFGVKDNVSKEPIDNDTMFEAASMSKPVFAYVVMKLCEQGVMNLDTPLTRYTPERFLEGDPRFDLITARHVLSHTSGFQNWREQGNESLSIHFTPGEKYLYSGEGYNYLQTVVTPARATVRDLHEGKAFRVIRDDFQRLRLERQLCKAHGTAARS